MCSKGDSDETYCSEVEELIKAASGIKSSTMDYSTQYIRRSQRILERTKKKVVDFNDFCPREIHQAKKKTKNYSTCRGVITQSQEVFSTQDLREEQNLPSGLISQQTETLLNKNSKAQCGVPLDLSKKSKESANETSSLVNIQEENIICKIVPFHMTKEFKIVHNRTISKESSTTNSKLISKPKISAEDCKTKTSKKNNYRRKSQRRKPSEENENVKSLSSLEANKTLGYVLDKKIGNLSAEKISLLETKNMPKSISVDITEKGILNKTSKSNKNIKLPYKNIKTTKTPNSNELQYIKSRMSSLVDVDLSKSSDIISSYNCKSRGRQKKKLVFNNSSKLQDENNRTRINETKKTSKSQTTTLTDNILKSRNKRTKILNENIVAKIAKMNELKTNSKPASVKTTKSIRKSKKPLVVFETAITNKIKNGELENNSTDIETKMKLKNSINTSTKWSVDNAHRNNVDISRSQNQNQMCKTKNSLPKIKGSQKSLSKKVKIIGNLCGRETSEKCVIKQNCRKTLRKTKSEEKVPKTIDWGNFKPNTKYASLKNFAIPIKEITQKSILPDIYPPHSKYQLPSEAILNHSLPISETFNEENYKPHVNYEYLQNLTPATSTQGTFPKSVLPDVYPPHFKYQLPPEAIFTRSLSAQPTCIITPEDTLSVGLLNSSSSSPSLPESLCELLETKDIKEILKVDKVAYRLYDFHIQPLAFMLKLNHEYLRKILDKTTNISPNVLKNIEKAVKEPFIKDEDLFTNTPDESLESEDVVFNSQSPKKRIILEHIDDKVE